LPVFQKSTFRNGKVAYDFFIMNGCACLPLMRPALNHKEGQKFRETKTGRQTILCRSYKKRELGSVK
jgi:hypothetical protein